MFTADLIAVALAMSSFEGWNPMKGSTPLSRTPTLSYRNHNPGNLRRSPFQAGQRDGFAVFHNDVLGFFALCWDINAKATGNTSTGLTGESTIEEFIHVWAPPSENNTGTYVEFVEKHSRIPRTTKLKDLVAEL